VVADVPGNIMTLERAMLLEVALEQLRSDGESFEQSLDRWFGEAIELLNTLVSDRPVQFDVVPATFGTK